MTSPIRAPGNRSDRVRQLAQIGVGILPYLVFLALDVWSLRDVLTTPGIIGRMWDWSIPAFAEQNLAQAQSIFWSWDELIGGGGFNPLKSLFNYFITFPLGTFGGEVHSKALVVLLLWASAVGMYLLARKGLRLNAFWGTSAGVLHMLSPIAYSRLISGYLNLLVAQTLLPILVLLCLQILDAAGRRSPSLAWKTVAAGVVLGVSQASHSSIFILAPLCVAIVLGLGLTRANVGRVIVAAAAVFLLGLLLNISWITSFGINYLSSGALFHGGGSQKPTDQITLASVTDWRQGLLDSVSQPMYEPIRLNAVNGVATEIIYPIPDSLANAWLFVSFLLPLSVFALLLARRGLTSGVLSLIILGLVGVAMVSGTRTIVGTSLFQFLKAFAPPAWAEFGNTTRAFPLVALSYCVLAPLTLQYLSDRSIDWIRSKALPKPTKRMFAAALGVLLFAGVAIWSAPFLFGDIARNSDKADGLHFYTVQPEDRSLYKYLQANPDNSRMTLIPPPGIWGVSDYGWVWEVGSISPRPKFLAASYNPAAWRAASDFSVFSPNSRAGKLLGLAAVEQVVFPFARTFDEANQARYAAVLAAQPDLKAAATPFTGTAILDNQSYLPRLYAAPAATLVLGSSDLLAPLSTTPYMGDKPALFFSTQQTAQGLDTLASSASQVIAPFQSYTVTASSLITAPVGFAYVPVSIEARPFRGLNDSVTRVVSFPDTSVASEGTFSVADESEYVARLSVFAPAGTAVTTGQPAFTKLDDSISEVPSEGKWKLSPASSSAEHYTWSTNTLFDKRAAGQGALAVRALLGDPSNRDARVELTSAIQPFNLDDYPILQIASRVQDPAVQLVEVHLGLDWDGDDVADDNWALPIVPRTESRLDQFAVRDFVKREFANKPAYRVVSVMLRLTRRPKLDQQRVQVGLYSFGLSEISFRASNEANAKAIHFLPFDAVNNVPKPQADSGIAAAYKPEGLTLAFPVGDRDTVATLERSLADVNTQEYPVYSVAYQTDGAATFALDVQISGLGTDGGQRTILLGTRLVEPFSRGTLVFTAPQFTLHDARVQVLVSKLLGLQELRGAIVTLNQFKISRQALVPYKEAQPTAPSLLIDGKPVALSPMPASDGRTGTWFTSQSFRLSKGNHSILAGYDDSTAPYRVGLAEIVAAKALPAVASNAPAISFRQINPTRYLAHVENATAPFFLVFSESFHAGWQAYVQNGQDTRDAPWYEQSPLFSWMFDSGKRTEIADHHLVNGYANSWYVQRKGSYNIVLEFAPQRLYEAGILVSISTPIVCFILLAVLWLRRSEVRGSN